MSTFRPAFLLAATLALAACGGGSTGTTLPPNTLGPCDPGTQVELARPFQGQTGIPPSTTSIEIVANGNGNTLGNSFQNFDLFLQPSVGGTITSSPLAAVQDTSGPHPFGSDFFYSGNIPGLQFGVTYTVFLNAFTSNCSPVNIGSFST
jgi:hypothetical protein